MAHLLIKEPSRRIDLEGAREHEWFNEVRKQFNNPLLEFTAADKTDDMMSLVSSMDRE